MFLSTSSRCTSFLLRSNWWTLRMSLSRSTPSSATLSLRLCSASSLCSLSCLALFSASSCWYLVPGGVNETLVLCGRRWLSLVRFRQELTFLQQLLRVWSSEVSGLHLFAGRRHSLTLSPLPPFASSFSSVSPLSLHAALLPLPPSSFLLPS